MSVSVFCVRHLRCRSVVPQCPVLASSASEDYVPTKEPLIRSTFTR